MQKRRSHLDWDDLRVFQALAGCRTVSAAAARLKVDHATVSRRIDRLESVLGVRLFDRGPDGYRLTAEGEALHARTLPIERSLEDLTARAAGADPMTATVTLSMVRSLADGFVVGRLGAFHREHPGIRLAVGTDPRNVSVTRREADVAIRLNRPGDGESLTRRLATIGYILCGTPELVARFAAEEPVPGVGFSDELADLPEARWMERVFGADRLVLRTNSHGAQAAAARAGFGLTLLPGYMVPGSGLEPVPEGAQSTADPPAREAWMLVRRDVAQRPAVRAVMDGLVRLFADGADLLRHGGHGRG